MKEWVNTVWGANSPWQNVFAVVVMGFAAAAGGGAAFTLLGVAGMLTSDVAAWVQAIGSLVGLAIAIAVPRGMHEAAKRQRREAQLALVAAAAQLGWHTTRAMYSCSIKLEAKVNRIPLDRMKDVQANFHLLMAKDVPAEAVPAILEILCEVSYHIAAAELHNSGLNDRRDKIKRAWTRTTKVYRETQTLAAISGNPNCLPEFTWPSGPWEGKPGPVSATSL